MKTYHDGASEERACIKRRIVRMARGLKEGQFEGIDDALQWLLGWIKARQNRYKKRKGGL